MLSSVSIALDWEAIGPRVERVRLAMVSNAGRGTDVAVIRKAMVSAYTKSGILRLAIELGLAQLERELGIEGV